MVELKKVVFVQNVNEKEPALETVAVENEQLRAQDSKTPDKTTKAVEKITMAMIIIMVFATTFVVFIGHGSPRAPSPEHAQLQGQIQQIKGLYDSAPPKPMPNHRIYPEADLYASEEFRKDMAKLLNEQQQKFREIGEQSAAGEDKAGNNGSHTQH